MRASTKPRSVFQTDSSPSYGDPSWITLNQIKQDGSQAMLQGSGDLVTINKKNLTAQILFNDGSISQCSVK